MIKIGQCAICGGNLVVGHRCSPLYNKNYMQNNDEKMIKMMVEMTRFFCGEEKANQINLLSSKVASEDDWLELKIQKQIDVWEPKMIGVSDFLTAKKLSTLEEILKLEIRNEIPKREWWGGLLHYVTGSAAPTYKGRTDWALHFVFGAWIELTIGLGKEAGVWKEWMDKNFGTGQYDEKDIEATIEGAMSV